VLTLYNDMVRKRHGFLQLARHRIKKRVQHDQFYVRIQFLPAPRTVALL